MKCISPRGWVIALTAIGLALTAQPAKAAFFEGSLGTLSASADFQLTGPNTLTVVLTNTAGTDALVPANVLTALYVTYGGGSSHILSANTAIASGTVQYLANPSNVDVGGEWAYATNINPPGGPFAFGIGSAGLGLFDENGLFGGPNLDGPVAPDGMQFGIVNAGFQDGDGNPGMDSNPFIRNSVTFTFTVSNDFNLDLLTGVRFQYGTALTEPSFGGGGSGAVVPAPAGLILLATAFPVLALRRVIRRKQAAA